MKLDITDKKKYYLLFAVFFLVFGVVVALLTSAINYNIKYTDIEKQLSERADSEFTYKYKGLKDYVYHIEMILKSITTNELTTKYIDDSSEINRKNLNNLFYSLSFSNKNIMQLRFLDANGYEKIRIDRIRKSGEIKEILPENMQNKSNRYYFIESSEIAPESFWHSNIDLNIEHGEIEMPINPTFRVATPFYEKGQFKGILIANVIMDDILEALSSSINFNVYLVDKDGEVITSPDKDHSWSRYLNNRPNIFYTFNTTAKKILSQDKLKLRNLFSFSFADIFNNNENIKIIMVPKNEIVAKLKKSNTFSALLIALTVLLVSIPLSWAASFIPSKLHNNLIDAYDEIKNYTDIIDSNIATTKTDCNGRIIDVSSKFIELTGYSKSELVNQTYDIIKHPDTSLDVTTNICDTLASGNIWEGEAKYKKKSGEDFWVFQTITPEMDKEGRLSSYTYVASNITDKKFIEHMSITDRLTQIHNRHKLDSVLESERNRFARFKTIFSVLLIDADHFKAINDTHGHQVGDNVLVKLAQIIKENTRVTDFVGRWGGEEFLIVATETSQDNAFLLAEKIRMAVESADFSPAEKVTISIGVAEIKPGETSANVINRADNALYKAKNEGRNKTSC